MPYHRSQPYRNYDTTFFWISKDFEWFAIPSFQRSPLYRPHYPTHYIHIWSSDLPCHIPILLIVAELTWHYIINDVDILLATIFLERHLHLIKWSTVPILITNRQKHFSLHWRLNDHDGVSNHQLMVVYSIVYSGADQRKNQSSVSLAFMRGNHRSRWIPRTEGQ